jgi:flagellar protein FlbT
MEENRYEKVSMTMPLRLDLLPFDEVFIGRCVLKNSHERASFTVEGQVPILQGKDVLSPERASTALEKLYCCVQRMYLEEAYDEHQASYMACAARSLTENPSIGPRLELADQLVLSRQYFKALRILKQLLEPHLFTVKQGPSDNYVPRYGGWKKKTV